MTRDATKVTCLFVDVGGVLLTSGWDHQARRRVAAHFELGLQFGRVMFAQSRPYPEMIELIAQLKGRYGLKVAVVSNEGRELNAHRLRTFKLGGLVDMFVSSSSSTSESRTWRSSGHP